jgi:hypothetical protein
LKHFGLPVEFLSPLPLLLLPGGLFPFELLPAALEILRRDVDGLSGVTDLLICFSFLALDLRTALGQFLVQQAVDLFLPCGLVAGKLLLLLCQVGRAVVELELSQLQVRIELSLLSFELGFEVGLLLGEGLLCGGAVFATAGNVGAQLPDLLAGRPQLLGKLPNPSGGSVSCFCQGVS